MKNPDATLFEEWMFLAKVDPELFEARRRRAIAEFLESSGSQRAIGEALQREIDFEIRRAHNPLAGLQAVAKMMCEQLTFLGEELNALRDVLSSLQRVSQPERRANDRASHTGLERRLPATR